MKDETNKFLEPVCYVNPLSDFAFKRMFGQDGCQEELKHLVNMFASEHIGPVTKVEYLPNEVLGLEKDESKTVFDVLCKTQNDDYCVVEMQKVRQYFPIERAIAYASRLISNSLTIKDKTYKIAKIFVICIMEKPDRLALKRNKKIWFVNFKDDNGNIISENPTFCIVELGIFARKNIVPKTEQELFMHVLNNMQTMTNLPEFAKGNSFFEAMFMQCNYNIFNDMEKTEYKKSIWEYEDVKSGVRRIREDAFLDGVDEGLAKGKAEGRAEGKAEEKLQIARSMLNKGLDISLITEITGLSEDEILKLKI